jgi:hypothetical protein
MALPKKLLIFLRLWRSQHLGASIEYIHDGKGDGLTDYYTLYE